MTGNQPAGTDRSTAQNSSGFSQISIHNYRGIAELDLQELSQINMIFGENNCGKTTVLEAAFILTAPSNTSLIIMVDNFRNLKWQDARDVHLPFHQLSFSHPINICGKLIGGVESYEITFSPFSSAERSVEQEFRSPSDQKESPTPIQKESPTPIDRQSTVGNVIGLKSMYKKTRNGELFEEFTQRMRVDSGGINFELEPNVQISETLSAVFISQSMDGVRDIGRSIMMKKKDQLLNNLQTTFNPAIKDIGIYNNLVYLDVEGQEMSIPLNLMGGGTESVLKMLASIYSHQDHIILIDEFENGLFHATLDKFWEPLFKAVEEANAQIFLTFHSMDVLKSLTRYLEKNKGKSLFGNEEDKVALYNLRRLPGGKHKAYRYTVGEVIYNLREGIEIRD